MKKNVLDKTSVLNHGHKDFLAKSLYLTIKKNFLIKENQYIQRIDNEGSKMSTSPNLLLFFMSGFFYFLSVSIIKFRKINI